MPTIAETNVQLPLSPLNAPLATPDEVSDPGQDVDPGTEGQSIVRIRRFCSLTDASLSAAIGDAIEHLDMVLADIGVPSADHIAVIYRNRSESTVTVDIAVFFDPLSLAAPSELENDRMPVGPQIAVRTQPGVAGLIEAQSLLLGELHATEHEAVWWETFSARQFRPWRGRPTAQLHLALRSLTPGKPVGGLAAHLPV